MKWKIMKELIYKLLDKIILFEKLVTRSVILIPFAIPVFMLGAILIIMTDYDSVADKRVIGNPTVETFFDTNVERLIKKSGKVYFSTVHYSNRNNVLKQYMKFFVKDGKGKEICINNYMSYGYSQATPYLGKKCNLKDTLIVQDMDLYFINQELNKRLRKDINFEVRYA